MARCASRHLPATLVALALLLAACGTTGHGSGRGSGPSGGPAARSAASGPPSSATASTQTASAPGSSVAGSTTGADWPTYHHDAARSGTAPASPPAGPLVSRWATHLDGAAVYAEPLVANGLVVVATEGDTVFGLQAATGQVRWHTSLGQPVSGGALPCGDIDPSGITGTPVIDQATGSLWVVAFVRPGRHLLYRLDLASGAVRSRQVVDPPGSNPLVEQQRGALALSQGRIYVPFGGLYGDCGDYHGYLVSAGPGAGPLGVYQVPSQREGAVWAPSGPAVDQAGDLYVATGNGSSLTSFDGGNAVIRLSPGLVRQDYFAPSNFAQLNADDADLGSTGPLLVGNSLVFQIGKSGVGYLLDAAHLGGIGHPAFSAPVCPGGAYGATAASGSLVLVACTTGLVALRIGAASFAVAWRAASSGRPGAPVVAGGVVWALDTDHGYLVGLDLATGAAKARASAGHVAHFATPTVSGSLIYVAGPGGLLAFSGA